MVFKMRIPIREQLGLLILLQLSLRKGTAALLMDGRTRIVDNTDGFCSGLQDCTIVTMPPLAYNKGLSRPCAAGLDARQSSRIRLHLAARSKTSGRRIRSRARSAGSGFC